jgi:hypothetical protein
MNFCNSNKSPEVFVFIADYPAFFQLFSVVTLSINAMAWGRW